MNEQECLRRMVAPGTPRKGKWRGGVIQVWVTRACDKACFGCTQASNLGGDPGLITTEQFGQALTSLKGYFGVVGVFGGNPAKHPDFPELCRLVRKHVPYEQRGLWCNNPMSVANAQAMRATFNPAVSNLNVHLDRDAYLLFREHWPEAKPFGLENDSRHAPPYVAMKDVGITEEERWDLISDCDINQHWSAMIGVFRGELRAWFCEIAGAQSMLHQHEPDYPDTGTEIDHPEAWRGKPWWQWNMSAFADQVRKHCHECGVPLRSAGSLSQDETGGVEQVSETHLGVYKTKRRGRRVELITVREELESGRIATVTDYVGNAKR